MRGRWVARVQLHREPPGPNGRPRYREVEVLHKGASLTSTSREAEGLARRFADRMQLRYDEGTWPPPEELPPRAPEPAAPSSPSTSPVMAWVTAWVSTQTYVTAAQEKRRVKAWLPRTKLGATALGTVTPQNVAAFLVELRSLPTVKDRPPSERYQRNLYDVVARALRAAVFAGHLAADPTSVVPTEFKPKNEDADPEARAGYRFALADAEKLLGSEPSDRWRTLWWFLAATGVRSGEMLAVRWSDLLEDKPLRRVSVARQVNSTTHKIARLKTKDTREVPELPALRAVLDAWRGGWKREFGREPRGEDLLFPAVGKGPNRGKLVPMWPSAVRAQLLAALARTGIRHHRMHDFRHTFASLCADAGMQELVAARWTHSPQGRTARHLYAAPAWARQCEEMLRLQITPRAADMHGDMHDGRAAGRARSA